MLQTLPQKFLYSLLAGLLFLIINFTNNYFHSCFQITDLIYVLIFFILFFVIIFIIDQFSNDIYKKTFWELFKYSFYATLLYYFLSSPQVYKLTNYIPVGILDNNCPSFFGEFIHSIIFMIIIFCTTFFN